MNAAAYIAVRLDIFEYYKKRLDFSIEIRYNCNVSLVKE